MTRRTAALLLLVLLLLAAGIGVSIAFLGEDAPPSTVPSTPPESAPTPREPPRRAVERRAAEESAPAVEPGASKHGPEPAVAPVAKDAVPQRRLKIRVLTEGGTAAEGAEVEAWADAGTLGPGTWEYARRAAGTTDAEGRVTLPFTGWSGYAVARRQEQAGLAAVDLAVDPAPDEEVTIRLCPATTVRGRVVDPADAPVPGALVRLS